MLRPIYFTLIFLLLATPCIAIQRTYVGIELSPQGKATEKIELSLDPYISKGNVSIVFHKKPAEIYFNGNYSLTEQSGRYVLILEKKNLSTLNLTVYHDELVEVTGLERVLRATYAPMQGGDVLIDVKLPPGFILSQTSPNAIPKPDYIESDGQTIVLKWRFAVGEEGGISVFYKGQNSTGQVIQKEKSNGIAIGAIVTGILAGAIILFLWAYLKNTSKKVLEEVLSPEEMKVVDELRAGSSQQKDIADKLEFSKSKMSKIVRRLEEKGIVTSKPHFKTNLIKLSQRIK